jgi:DNA-binding transcriptional ArsR family regulator/catechol 2,3-dioxygenase-like lactoylglutathione lyase family enzyme
MSQESLTEPVTASAVFAALADPIRRRLLEELAAGERPAGELAAGVPVSRSAVSQHLTVLRSAGLVERRRSGRQVWYRASRAGAAPAAVWVDRFAAVQLTRSTPPGEPVALQVSAVAVPVAEQTRASRFYQSALGFSVVTDRTVQGWRWVSLLPPGGSCAIGLVRAQHAGIWTGISLLTDDITTLYQQWRRHGVAFDGPPARQAWGARTALFADLDGNRLQLVEVPRASTV